MVIRTGDRVLRSKFVDRKKEMSELKKNVEDVIKGKGNLVFIEGEAGVGKTRLIEELKAWVKVNQQNVQLLSGKCIFREGSEPYLPFTDALREYHERNLKVELIGVVPENGEPLEQFSIEMIPLLEPATSVSKASETKSIIGEELLIGDEAPELDGTDKGREELRATEISETSMPIGFIPTIIKSIDAETLKLEQDKMFEIISNQLINLSKSGPVILFLDDLQWADDATLRLLHYIAEKTGDSPILIYGVYRPEELQLSEEYQQSHPLADTIRRLSREKIFKKIKLERLPFNATESMIKLILSRDEIPKEFSDWLFKKTEGNPFFIEEVILSFIEEGLIDPKAYLWPTELDLSQLSKIKIPMTIGDLIIRRLDRLDSNDLKILSYAALIGREFDYDVLKDLSGFEEEKLLDSLDRLINSGLIHEDFTTKDEERYKFDNVMIQDIAYSGLSRVRRRLMHRKVAEIIEDTNRTRIGMVIYELAHHHYEGKVWNKAVYYLIKAAEKASSLYALSEAIYYYKLALEGLLKLEQTLYNSQLRIGILENIGHLRQVLGDWDNALSHYQEELRAVKNVEDFIKSDKYDPKKHGSIEENWLKLKQSEAFRNLADIYRRKSEWQLADKNYRNGLKISEKLEDFNGLADAHRGMGYVHWRTGELKKAISHYDRSIKFGKKSKNQSVVSIVFIELGNIYNYKGDWDLAIQYYHKSIRSLEKLETVETQQQRLQQELARAYNNLGDIHIKKKKWEKAIGYFEKCEKIANKIGDSHMIAWSIFNAGECYAKNRELKQGIKNCKKALKLLTMDDKIGIAATFKIMGIIKRFENKWDRANKYFQDSIKMFKELNIPYDLAVTNFECGLMFKDKGDKTSANKYFKNALSIFKKLGATKEMKEVRKEL